MPTSSQLTNTWKRLSASTRLSIEKQNSDRNMKNRPKRPRRCRWPSLGVDLVVLDHRLQLVAHVADREEVDERGDERHHQEHDGGQAVDAVAELQDGGRARGRATPAGCDRSPGRCDRPSWPSCSSSCFSLGCLLCPRLSCFVLLAVRRAASQLVRSASRAARGASWSLVAVKQDEADQAADERQADGAGGDVGRRRGRGASPPKSW